MQRIRPWWLALATLASFLAIGIPYWRIPYHDLNLPDALMTPWLLLAMALALRLCFTRAAPSWLAASMTAVAVVAVAIVRINIDTAHDPTSHNLWPLELVIALGVGVAAALPVALIGGIARALLPDSRDPR
jgi:hypothetical protein